MANISNAGEVNQTCSQARDHRIEFVEAIILVFDVLKGGFAGIQLLLLLYHSTYRVKTRDLLDVSEGEH